MGENLQDDLFLLSECQCASIINNSTTNKWMREKLTDLDCTDGFGIVFGFVFFQIFRKQLAWIVQTRWCQFLKITVTSKKKKTRNPSPNCVLDTLLQECSLRLCGIQTFLRNVLLSTIIWWNHETRKIWRCLKIFMEIYLALDHKHCLAWITQIAVCIKNVLLIGNVMLIQITKVHFQYEKVVHMYAHWSLEGSLSPSNVEDYTWSFWKLKLKFRLI